MSRDLRPLEAALGLWVVEVLDATEAWATVRTEIVTLADGRRLVLHRGPDRTRMTRRAEVPQVLSSIAPWLPVPLPVAADLAAREPWVATPFVEGTPGRALLETDAGARALGVALRTIADDLRRVAVARLRLPDLWAQPRELADAAEGWIDREAETLGETTDALKSLVRRIPDAFVDIPPVFAHGDLAPVNVIVRDARVVALLDFEHARLAHPLFDTARLRWIVRYHHEDRWPAVRSTFLPGTDSAASTPTAWLLNLLGALQCLEELIEAPGSASTEWGRRVSAILAWPDV